MSRLLLLVLLCGGAALAAPKKKSAPPPPPPLTAPTPKVVENVGDKVLGLLERASSVQVFRVSDSGGLRPDPAKAIGTDFVRGEQGKALEAAELKRLKQVLWSDKSYRFEQDVSRCRFEPHLSFRAQAGLETLEVVTSFKCNQVFFFVGKPQDRWLPGGAFDVRPARAALLELARVALPNDVATRQLK